MDRGPELKQTHGGLPGIEGLRALAACSVLVYHVWRFGAPNGERPDLGVLSSVMPHLWHGVTLFFVLSGFLLYRSFAAAALRGTAAPNIVRYAGKRALRILPAYWVVLLVTVFVLQVALVPDGSGGRTEGVPGFDLLVLNVLFLQNYSVDSIFTGIGPAWSLSVEVVFYAVLPLLGLLALRLTAHGRGRRTAVLVPIVLLLLVGASSKLAMFGLAEWELGVSRSFWGLADMFGLGMLVAVVHIEVQDGRLALPRFWRAGTVTLIGGVAVLLAVGTTQLEPRELHQYASGIVSALLLGLVVIPGAGGPRGIVRVLETRVPLAIGPISYGVFLWHEPLLRWLRLSGATADGAVGFVLNLAVVGLATGLLATLTYRYVEVPALRLKTRGRPDRPVRPSPIPTPSAAVRAPALARMPVARPPTPTAP